MKNFSLVLSVDNKNGIGKNNAMPWKINADIQYFKEVTTKTNDLGKHNAVIMGRKTWDSIPKKFKPLSDRVNCVISTTLKHENKNSKIDDFVLYFTSLDSALKELEKKDNIENIFIIGGSKIFNEALNHKNIDKIYLTEIDGDFDCDTFVDLDLEDFEIESKGTIQEEDGIKFRFMVYKKQESSN